ncbi:MAG TPA: limonene-1,2-epoxide hydrolase family protein [Vicinamibacterales bacterium]|nr:limonene-1,2-epoxide hydrolase family protein [Vicinamibacterales bacterium]
MRSTANEQLVMDFFHAMGPTIDDVIRAWETYMTPDAVWKNSGFPDMVGIEQIKHLLREQKRLFNFERVKVLEHRLLTSADDTVFFERRDSIVDANDAVVYAFDILGAFKIANGRIIEWRDYMDTSVIRRDWNAQDPTGLASQAAVAI